MNVLVADDDALTRLLLEHVAADAGHAVTSVEDGARAWQAFETGEFALVMLDWLMPGLSGLEVCQRIRASGRSDSTFVLMVTGRDREADLIGALDGGVDDYVVKPVIPHQLRARLVIAEKRIQQAAERLRTREELKRRQRMAAIGEMSVALQHEINNPLGALIANAQLAETTESVAELREHLSIISEQAYRIADVLKRLRSLDEPRAVEYLPGSKMLDLSRDSAPE